MSFIKLNSLAALLLLSTFCFTQNSMVGDSFGGRLWYSPTNYTVGSYSGYSICYDDSSQLYGWGDNGYNQLGLGSSVSGVNVPTPIPNMTNVKFFSTGYIMGAIKNDGSGWAWGNPNFLLGVHIPGSPIQVISNTFFLDASSSSMSFIKNDGTVWSLGNNNNGNFGDGNVNPLSVTTPVQMLNVNDAVRVANSFYTTIVLRSDSTLWSVGNNYYGGLGVGTSITQTLSPIQIPSLPKIIDVKSTPWQTVALAANGDVYFWGTEYIFEIPYFNPVILPNLTNIVAISGCDDGFHFLALDADKNCYAFGNNGMGQCGISPTSSGNLIPQLVATDVIDIMAGETFSYIVKSDGSLWASGSSNLGGSIWLNLSDNTRDTFTQIDLSVVPETCPIVGDNIPVTTFQEEDTISITFPNVFSPNGDGENDVFYFPNIGVQEMYWEVYNRWGMLMFKATDKNQKWNGKTLENKECPEGTYYYILNYKFWDKDWKRKKGFITLLR